MATDKAGKYINAIMMGVTSKCRVLNVKFGSSKIAKFSKEVNLTFLIHTSRQNSNFWANFIFQKIQLEIFHTEHTLGKADLTRTTK